MSNDRPRRPSDPWKTAEAAFKPAVPKGPVVLPKKTGLPGAKETVSLRLDRDVIEHFQNEGIGWQDRINEILRQSAGLSGDEGLKPDQLTSENDG